jgi:hypothetical protein
MARLAGTAGSVTVAGAAAQAGIKSWKLDHTFDTLDSTGFDSSGHRTFLPGLDTWSGSFEGYKDGAPLTIGTEIALLLKQSATGTQDWGGQAIITGSHPAISTDGLSVMSYDFQGTGAITTPST